jgi:hypothetical protein
MDDALSVRPTQKATHVPKSSSMASVSDLCELKRIQHIRREEARSTDPQNETPTQNPDTRYGIAVHISTLSSCPSASMMTESEMGRFRARCAPTVTDGRFEPYKVSPRYDNQMTRMPHGFPFDHTQREVTEMLANADGPWLVPETPI